jgi:hypothetical protein
MLHVLFVDVDGRPYLSASITLVQLLLNISIHLNTLHCGKRFCPYLVANFFNWSLPLSFLQTPKNALLLVACASCKPVVEQSSLCHAHLAQTTHSQHVTVRPWATEWPGLSSVVNHTTKIFQYWLYFFNLFCTFCGALRFGCLPKQLFLYFLKKYQWWQQRK